MTHVVTVDRAQERFLAEALVSVRKQTYGASRTLVVRWGEGTDIPDLATARNQGLARAGGRYARLLEASDTLPWHSTAVLVRALVRADAASAAGRSQRGQGWRDRAFAPAPGVDPGLADRLIDLARWRASSTRLEPTHGRFGDAALVALDAAGVVRVDQVTHEDRARTLGLAFGHLRRWHLEADAWLDAVETAAPAAGTGWVGALLDHRLPAVLSDVERLDQRQWRRLQDLATSLLARLGEDVADPDDLGGSAVAEDLVRVESRVLAWLTAVGARDRVTDLVLRRWRAPDDVATSVRDGVVLAELGIDGVPRAARRLGPRETPLVLHPVRRTPDRLALVSFVRGVATDEPPVVGARYAGAEVAARSSADPAATRIAAEAEHAHDHAWLEIDLGGAPATGLLELTLTSHGVTRTGAIEVPAALAEAPRTDPRGEDEIGPHAQLVLQRWYASDEHRVDPDLAYFQAYTGQAATDSPLAIHRALRRAHPHVRTRWLVDDLAVPVPEGAESVLLRSRAWYSTLATAHWLVTNVEMERWFRRRPDQRLVQTWHGNPGKTMGRSAWEQAGLTPGRIEQTLDHGPRTWTLLVSPSPAMTPLYREQFDYDGPVEEHGYPRDDDLVGPRARELRRAARTAFGIADDETAVLYAPTWRDHEALDYRRARLASGLDVAAAARALGRGHVLLLRGHRFHRERTTIGGAGARVLDVTEHPEVNDVLLAADAAVLDYSSIRFDFALTGRPMVFCVPDLEEVTGGRGFLYDYASSAPGPLLRTTEEVVAALRDLPGLTERYADERAAFHQRFNAFQDGHAAERVVARFFADARTS